MMVRQYSVPASQLKHFPAQIDTAYLLDVYQASGSKPFLSLCFSTPSAAALWSTSLESLIHNDDAGLLEGWGWKLENDSWKSRYMVQRDARLWILEMIPKGSISLASGVSVHSLPQPNPTEDSATVPVFCGPLSASNFSYRLNVSDQTRIYYMAADNEPDRDLWIRSIEQCCKDLLQQPLSPSSQSLSQLSLNLPSSFIEAVEQQAPEGLVTFVFTDVQSSTTLWEKVPEDMVRNIHALCHAMIHAVLLIKWISHV